MDFLYDGSFEGLLTAVFEAYYRHEVPERILSRKYYQESLLDQVLYIRTDPSKAYRVYRSIKEKISPLCYKNVYYTFLSEHEDAATWIYNYLRLGWSMGKEVDSCLADEQVLKVHSIVRKVVGERHRMLGFIRFKLLADNIYYAGFEPDYNIVGLLAPHFSARLPDQNWILHDVKRSLAVLYNKKRWTLTPFSHTGFISASDCAPDFQELWKQYFKRIAIPNRRNPKLQKRNMPVRYWKYLTEKQLPG
ncbi:MAG: TIGR03915 family putative DNA repair protein [Clostridiales bacterium]|jgi:probable DNA metabolism protein|nr:TIGR03915 family putative DNA repair protein [Eubacteriales bacterium]MDH7565202.1 TIGR03915 family putative DNA repair protein [Clostridiales bacterium]